MHSSAHPHQAYTPGSSLIPTSMHPPHAEDARADQAWRRTRAITRVVVPILYGAFAGVAAAFGVAVLLDDAETLPSMSATPDSVARAELGTIAALRPRPPTMTILHLDDVIIPRALGAATPASSPTSREPSSAPGRAGNAQPPCGGDG